MSFDLDSALGIHPQALVLRGRRAALLAANLANADTPGYKARDVDFRSVLARSAAAAESGTPLLRVSHPQHLSFVDTHTGGELLFRRPAQSAVDGNTVDSQMEKAEYAQNALRYMASLTFLNGRLRSLIGALRGE